ncbi:uncharacterized protein A1O9_04506 [Exophiala aquamarina CBS 119918]|uniref:Ran-binding-domain-containing protein n=1 Tax=Exophiala aquamarina CBS 119918 TaxID=1182545 RepID=A0A072PVR0_9EURO|nr:uncharacterized protein A1O9_04506 [Exophiala aquamarina CBS 119918]KEF59660.1 hypothetical protein A1O9_04506 [Exophiala aquamarina CBS 119918]
MDLFLGKVTQHAMNYAIRSGIGLTASFAIRQSAKLMSNAPKSAARDEVELLQQRLQHKIQIIAPAIDMIELIAARGNTSLESAVALTKELRFEIQSLARRLLAANASEEATKKSKFNSQTKAKNELELKFIASDTQKLLARIEDAVPLINLAITTSGASLSTSLPHTVSPSRLLQASTFLTAGDTQYFLHPEQAVQIGPTFTLTVYMLFAGHDRPQNEDEIRETTWKEVMHKASVKLRRVPLDVVFHNGSAPEGIPPAQLNSPGTGPNLYGSTIIPADAHGDEYAYQVMIIEDLDDDRYHQFEENEAQPGPFDDVKLAGVREMIPIHEISKIFYADTSKVLNIGSDAENNHPVLLLKRDLNAIPPRRMMEAADTGHAQNSEDFITQTSTDQQYPRNDHPERTQDPWRLPSSLDPEWIALEVYTEYEPSDSDSELENQEMNTSARSLSASPSPSNLAASLSDMHLNSSPSPQYQSQTKSVSPVKSLPTSHQPPWANQIRTSLSLLELLLRLTSLQQFQQQSHLSITDELLNFFLEEAASTGAGGDENYRQALRADARRRVGWDPYDESPVKRRGEEYLDRYATEGSGYPDGVSEQYTPRSTSASARGTLVGGSGMNGARRDSGPGVRAGAGAGTWSPRDASARSIPTMSDFQGSPSPSPSPGPRPSPSPMPAVPLNSTDGRTRARNGSRTAWLKREDGTTNFKGSPLRPSTGMTDEGIGTSPLSSTGAAVPDGGNPGERQS